MAGLSQAEADQIQGTDLGHATRDLLDAIDRGDYPEWELLVQLTRARIPRTNDYQQGPTATAR